MSRRIDGSGQSRTPPATTYSVFTAKRRRKKLAGEDLAELLDHAPARWSAEALIHNAHNTVTAGVWRVRAGPASFVLEVLSPDWTAASGE